jgi:hypothetical protein
VVGALVLALPAGAANPKHPFARLLAARLNDAKTV